MPQGKDAGGKSIVRGQARMPMGQMGPHHYGGQMVDPRTNQHYVGGNMVDRRRGAASSNTQGKPQGLTRTIGKGANAYGAPPGQSFSPHGGSGKATKGESGQKRGRTY